MSQIYTPLAGTDTFAASYTKINDSVDSAATWFLGPTAPAIFPGRPWIDTTADEIKLGNEAGDGWITLLKFGSTFGGALPVTGGGMSGSINMNGQTITALGLGSGTAAARQQEVDAKAPIAAPVFTGDAKVSQDPAGNDSIPRRSWTEGRYLKLSGGSLTGALVLNSYAGAAYHPVVLEQLQTFIGFNISSGHRHDGTDARKVRAADLDAGAATVGQTLVAQGGGAAAFQTVTSKFMAMLDVPIVLHNTAPPTSFTTVDVTPHVAAKAYVVFLRINLNMASAADAQMRFRKGGSSTNSAVQTYPTGAETVQTYTLPVEISSSKEFQFKNSSGASFSGSTFEMTLMGYMIEA